jgi:hypothetical protein
MSRSRAATVWARSPPASCRSTTAPVVPGGWAASAMARAPGRRQSVVSWSVRTMRWPAAAARRWARWPVVVTAAGVAEYGGRMSTGRCPVAAATALAVRVSSASSRRGGTAVMSGWVKVWLPISWPSARTRRARSGWALTRAPTWKNVARARCRARVSRMRGVQVGSGPSSKVRAMVRSGMPRVLTVSAGPRRCTAAPWVTVSGAGAPVASVVCRPSLPAWVT